jgi:undecaprenyl-diphosphatase
VNFLEAIFLGAIQGLTEWLPISSSAHIFLVETYFGLPPSLELAAWLHGGSFLAVLVFYRGRIRAMVSELWELFLSRSGRTLSVKERTGETEKDISSPSRGDKREHALIATKIAFATLISVAVILLLERSGVLYELSIQTVALTLAITGVFILVSEYFPKKSRGVSWPVVILFGLVQGVAAFPGISRAGITIAFLILAGVDRKKAVDFSFLAAIPILLGAMIFSVIDMGPGELSFADPLLWFALFVSFVTSLIGIHYMRKWVERAWVWFAPYCFLLAALLIVL